MIRNILFIYAIFPQFIHPYPQEVSFPKSYLLKKRVHIVSSYEDVECLGKNTFVNGTGKCECLAKFPYGDPNSAIGCWNCNPPCDTNAECFASDQCRCLPGFIGDGLDLCEKPVPELISMSPTHSYVNGGINITLTIKSPPKYNVINAFCRFGPIAVSAIFANLSTLICVLPKNKAGKLRVAASFDSSRWSKQPFAFEYIEKGINTYTYVLVFALLLIMAMILIVALWLVNRRREYVEQADEMLPLNKWHMNQESPVAVEEKGLFDFLMNITIN